MKCRTCQHPQRQAIDIDLLTEDHTFAALSQKYGLSASSLFRHKQHLATNMRRAHQRLQESQDQASLFKLNTFLDHVQRAVQAAEIDGNIDQVLKGSLIGSRIIRQISQMEVTMGLDTVCRLISSPQWAARDTILPLDPEIITGIRQDLAAAAFFPCPDLDPETISPAMSDPSLDIQNPEAENSLSPPAPPINQNPAPTSQLACDVEQPREEDHQAKNPADNLPRTQDSGLKTPPPSRAMLKELLSDLLTAAGITPKNQCHKSAKKPKNISPCDENIIENQLNSCSEENLPKSLSEGPESQAFPPTNQDSPQPEKKNQQSQHHHPEPATTDPGPPDPNKPLNPDTHPGDYLFAVTHGYRRDNPPKHIPDRRWAEDFGFRRKNRGY